MNPFRPEEARKYFQDRLGRELKAIGGWQPVNCCFHDDANASMSISVDKAAWRCHTCDIGGGLLQFEKRFSDVDDGTAWVTISDIIGQKINGQGKPEAVYVYVDEDNLWLFRKIRYPKGLDGKKPIFQERYSDRGTWEKGLDGVRQVLYNLPAVITANVIVVTEGEKCADRVNQLGLFGDREDLRCVATTAPGGASGWKSDFGKYFAGKAVLVFPDNDAPGRKYAEQAAKNAHESGARLVKIVNLPSLGDGEDIYDYLASHQVSELIATIKGAPQWKPPADGPTGEDRFFVDAVTFASTVADEVEWAVKPIIPRGANGFIVADPKSLKSFSAVNLVLHLALGKDWLGFSVPRRMRCAMLAREDAWQLTAWRIKHFLRGMDVRPEDVESLRREWLLFNTRMQSPNFALTNDEDLEQLIKNLKKRQTEFLMMDVFRMLYEGDEQDNSTMQQVLERVRKIQGEVGCVVGIVHHARKESEGTIFHRTRGASVIHGFMEWAVGLTTCNPEDDRKDWVRKMEFLTKNGSEPEPIYVKAEDGSDCIRLVRCDPPPKSRRNKPAQLVRNYYDKEESDE